MTSIRCDFRGFVRVLVTVGFLALAVAGRSMGSEETAPTSSRPQRLLLIGQGPNGAHVRTTHEYLAGVQLVAKLLRHEKNLELIVVSADGEWRDGPQLLARTDTAVLFVAEGAKWLSADSGRLTAFRDLAKRGGGLAALHWATGTKAAEPIEPFVQLFGGCHGGPDRQFKIFDVTPVLATPTHSILRGVQPAAVHEEFYFALKLAANDGTVTRHENNSAITPLVKIPVDGEQSTVSWCWERPDGGRSFGFTGLHFHDNWKHESYRRLVAQAVLWTLKRDVPKEGLDVSVSDDDLGLSKTAP